MVNIGEIKFDKCYADETFDKPLFDRLVKDIEINGMLHPIILDESLQIIGGTKRFLAHKKLRKKKILAFVEPIATEE